MTPLKAPILDSYFVIKEPLHDDDKELNDLDLKAEVILTMPFNDLMKAKSMTKLINKETIKKMKRIHDLVFK